MEMDDSRALAEIERTRGLLSRTAGDADRARAVTRQLGVREGEALALRGLGETEALTMFDESGDSTRRAQGHFDEAVKILDELGATRELARTRAAYGTFLVERGDVLNGR